MKSKHFIISLILLLILASTNVLASSYSVSATAIGTGSGTITDDEFYYGPLFIYAIPPFTMRVNCLAETVNTRTTAYSEAYSEISVYDQSLQVYAEYGAYADATASDGSHQRGRDTETYSWDYGVDTGLEWRIYAYAEATGLLAEADAFASFTW